MRLPISIHAARMGCDRVFPLLQPAVKISIHAARMGCDRAQCYLHYPNRISIHAARMGCDRLFRRRKRCAFRFQSTQPEWAATANQMPLTIGRIISIHAARMGCDNQQKIPLAYKLVRFQSTQPEWAATQAVIGGVCNRYDFNPRSPNGLRLNCSAIRRA